MFGTMQVLCYRQVSSVTITNEFLAPDKVSGTHGRNRRAEASHPSELRRLSAVCMRPQFSTWVLGGGGGAVTLPVCLNGVRAARARAGAASSR